MPNPGSSVLDRKSFGELVKRKVNTAIISRPGETSNTEHFAQNSPKLIFSGAFNPVHQGHLEIAKFAQSRLGRPLWFEISVINVDKGALSFEQAEARTQQCFGPHGLILTRAATFENKTALFKGSVFVVGADTVLRIAQPKYYDNSRSKMERAFEAFKNYQCRFLVFARKKGNKLYSGSNIDLLPALLEICDFVAPEEFHLDISSTQLRRVDE